MVNDTLCSVAVLVGVCEDEYPDKSRHLTGKELFLKWENNLGRPNINRL